MSHFGNDTNIEIKTPDEWLKVGSQIGQLVNEWAMRTDLVAHIGERVGQEHGAPAAYNPRMAEIEVNTKVAFGNAKPKFIGNLNERDQQFEFPKACGAIFHESCHARYSTWDLEKAARELTSAQNEALHLLEESRIERLGALTMPGNRVFLRSCALEIVLADMSDKKIASLTSTRQVATLVGLTYARVDAGVLEEEDIDALRPQVESLIPDETLEKMRAIWTEFQTLHPDYSEARMYELAIEWDKIVEETAEKNGEPERGEPGEGGSEGESLSAEIGKAIAEALKEAQEETELNAQGEAFDQQTREESEAEAKARQSKGEERKKHKDQATKVFGKGHTSEPTRGTNSKLTESRKPNSQERISAVTISKALEKAKYRDRERTQSASVTPPGRLRTRAIVQGQALRERNVMTQVEPWRKVQRKQVDDPTLTVGVMVDISGSMTMAMQPMASAAWILSEAVKRVQGKVAMVYYGNAVFPTLSAGQHLDEVKVYTAEDGTEKFDNAFQALDGGLDLLNGSGARLLVVVSDGEYTTDEQKRAQEWIQRCQRDGVGVLWIGAGWYGEGAKAKYCDGTDATFVRMGESATEVSMAIGKAAEQALTTAGIRRG
ncbi:MAG: VWA domain-containing protein [Betaproteobacteria bacterium]|nr:VWA domain-containing protein [Betaproteobacteria bacterium]